MWKFQDISATHILREIHFLSCQKSQLGCPGLLKYLDHYWPFLTIFVLLLQAALYRSYQRFTPY